MPAEPAVRRCRGRPFGRAHRAHDELRRRAVAGWSPGPRSPPSAPAVAWTPRSSQPAATGSDSSRRCPLPRKLNRDLLQTPGRLRNSVRAAGAVLDCVRAEIVVGFGGYMAMPAYLAARRMGPRPTTSGSTGLRCATPPGSGSACDPTGRY